MLLNEQFILFILSGFVGCFFFLLLLNNDDQNKEQTVGVEAGNIATTSTSVWRKVKGENTSEESEGKEDTSEESEGEEDTSEESEGEEEQNVSQGSEDGDGVWRDVPGSRRK